MKNGKTLKWLLTLACLLAAVCAFTFVANANIVDYGYCGAEGGGHNLTWTLDGAGTLSIRGTGEMENYSNSVTFPNYTTAPWGCSLENEKRIKAVVIENGVTSIGSYAFHDCYRLTGVTIPDSVTSIGYCAFDDCTGLTSLTFGNGVTSIGGSAFSGCTRLMSITIPDSVTSIGDSAFSGCTGLTSITIPGSVTSIGSKSFFYQNAGPFHGCTGLISVTIENGVTSIGAGAFYGCTRLTSVIIGNSVTSIGHSTFYNCTGLTSVTIPDSVTSIGGSAFYNCSGLTSVAIPDSVTSIGKLAFSGCTGLKQVNISSIKAWCRISFSDYDSNPLYHAHHLYQNGKEVTKLVIPDDVTSIGWGAFNGCTGLTSVTIGNGVTRIGGSAFSGCKGLTSVTIGNGVTSIGYRAFEYCTGLTSVTIPDSVTSIGDSAFRGCTGLTSVTIPDSVTSIGYDAFKDCNAIETLTVGKTIGQFTLSKMAIPKDSLKTVVITDGATVIKADAFDYYNAITSYTVSENNPAYSSEDGVLYNKEKTELIKYPYAKEGTTFTFPETVTAIADEAFADNQNLTEIRIPSRINSLGKGCFARCQSLQTVTCGNGAVALAEQMFKGCPALTAVTVPYGVDRIGKEAFSGCAALNSITMSSDMGMIEEDAFAGCKGLNDIFFNGTADEWTAIGVKTGNDALSGARKHFGAALTPLTVTGVEVIKTGDTSVTLQWKSAKGATEYRVYGMKAETQTWELLATVTQSPCEITKLMPETTYTLAVEAAVVTEEKTLTAGKSDPVTVNTLGHSWNEGEITTPPTCTKDGVKTFTCTVCKATKTEAIKAIGHKPVTDKAVAATCTADGKTEGSHCSVCGEVLTAQKTVKATGHNWDKGTVTKEATETSEGEMTFTCTVCGAKKTEAIPKLEPAQQLGDVDGDGSITAADARLALRASVGLTEKGDVAKDSAGYLACDVDRDGKVTSADARLILRASVGLEDPEKWKP